MPKQKISTPIIQTKFHEISLLHIEKFTVSTFHHFFIFPARFYKQFLQCHIQTHTFQKLYSLLERSFLSRQMKKLMEESAPRKKQNAQKKKDQKVKFPTASQDSSLSSGRRSISSLGPEDGLEIELFDSNEDIRERPIDVRPQNNLPVLPPSANMLKKKSSKSKKQAISQTTSSVSSLIRPIAEIPKRKSSNKSKQASKSKNHKKDVHSRGSDERSNSRRKISIAGSQFIKDSISTLSLEAQMLVRDKQQGGQYRQLKLQAENMRKIREDNINNQHAEHMQPNVRQIHQMQMNEQRRYQKRIQKQRRNRMMLSNHPQRIVDIDQVQGIGMIGQNMNRNNNRKQPEGRNFKNPFLPDESSRKKLDRPLPRHLKEEEIEDEERIETSELIVNNNRFTRQRSRSIWRKMKPNHYFVNEHHRRELQNLKVYEQTVAVSLEDNVFKGRPRPELQVKTIEFINNFSSFHLSLEQNMLCKTTLFTNNPHFQVAERKIEMSKLKQFQRYVDHTPDMRHLRGMRCSFTRKSMMRRSRREAQEHIIATQKRFLEAARSMQKKFPKQMGVMTDHFLRPDPKIWDNESSIRPSPNPSPSKSHQMDIEYPAPQRKKQLNVTKVTIDMSKPQQFKQRSEKNIFQQPYRPNPMLTGIGREDFQSKRPEKQENEVNRISHKQKILTQIEKANKMCNVQRRETYAHLGEQPRIPSAPSAANGIRKEPSSTYLTTCTVRSTESVKRQNKQEGDADSKKNEVMTTKEGKMPIPHPNPSYFSCNRSSKVKRLEILNRYHYNPFEETEGEDQCELWKKLMFAEISSIRANYSLGAKEEENQAHLIDNLFLDVEKTDRHLPIIHNGKLRENDFFVENRYEPKLGEQPQAKAAIQRKKLRKQKKEEEMAKAMKAQTKMMQQLNQRIEMQQQLPTIREQNDDFSMMSRGYRPISSGLSLREATTGWNVNAKEEESEDQDYVDDLACLQEQQQMKKKK